MNAFEEYNLWARIASGDSRWAWELGELIEIKNDPEEIRSRFSGRLAFGTGGIRELSGVGSTRMNRFTVRRITMGLCRWLLEKDPQARHKGVLVVRDSRTDSLLLAEETTRILHSQGFQVYLPGEPRPTPLLSFGVRYLGCAAGVVITASHNPAGYNGYKVYDHRGVQLLPDQARVLENRIPPVDFQESVIPGGAVRNPDKELCEAYLKMLSENLSGSQDGGPVVCYSPLHGAAGDLMEKAFQALGYRHFQVVEEEFCPDGRFPGLKVPNPEDPDSYNMALKMAAKSGALLVLLTDPDGDRLGVAVRDEEDYRILSGNETAALLLCYLLDTGAQGNILITTLVSGGLPQAVARDKGIGVLHTLTGFKFIGDLAESIGGALPECFLFGYEESSGFLAAPAPGRDKDGIQAALLTAEMFNWYFSQGKDPQSVLEELQKQYGYFVSGTLTLDCLPGSGLPDADWPDREVLVEDFLRNRHREPWGTWKENAGLPESLLLKIHWPDGSWAAIRPSGTEPHLKVYLEGRGRTRAAAEKCLDRIKAEVLAVTDTRKATP